MKLALITTAAMALSVAGAYACPMHKSAEADHMTVASIDAEKAPMTTVDKALDTATIVEPAEDVMVEPAED
ncbi:hypothetical protein FQ775_15585 [Nitratireductor mangrovi]|uniref:DUF680 domain-containing protein n=1 Tax=Nitratireductor mangrovi TaxID=2599600 RepID=A0A5B8L162_9HYPH|nr:hypothetical protein [Nitratireductor mangrovi]QDZ01675.1 hypothetical protein FQ775_15585 [Nitratireductor mangrovi]